MKTGWGLYIRGMCMGVADLIPGVSGGTVAFISGIYPQLMAALQSLNGDALSHLCHLRFKAFSQQVHLCFFTLVGLGILTSVVLLARLMHFLLQHHALLTWSFFFGLIAASVPFLFKQVASPRSPNNILNFLVGAMGGYLVTGLVPIETPGALWFIGLCGFISLAAMILPGISGSFILLILGKYEFITSVLKNPFGEGSIVVIACFSLGALLSLISLSRLLGALFRKYPDQMTALLTGVLLGSLRKVWPWKETVSTVVIRGRERILEAHNTFPGLSWGLVTALLAMVLGAVIILALDRMSHSSRIAQ